MNSKKMIKLFSALVAFMMLVGIAPTVFAAEAAISDTVIATVGSDSFNDLDSALAASVDEEEPAILVEDYILTSDLTVPSGAVLQIASGKTLTIPSSSDLNDTTTGNNASGKVTEGSAYVTLTVESGAAIDVYGTLLVAGNQQSTQPKSGCLTGNFGKIALNGNLTVESNGKLYARGEISGEGSVVADSGSTVYQLFQISDWRGGTASTLAYRVSNIFPFNLYELNNISVATTYNAGSELIGQSYIFASNTDYAAEVKIIGEGGELEFNTDTAATLSDGNITFTQVDGTTLVTVNGDVITNDMEVELTGIKVNSSGTVCPFGYNMDVVVSDGASLTIANDMKFLPGCDVTVKSGATVTIASGKSAYFYGEGDYLTTYNYAGWNGNGDPATLTIEDGATVSAIGAIASSDNTYGNITGFDGVDGTLTLEEYVQSRYSAVTVTFYTGPASSEENGDTEEVAEPVIEEVVEPEVESIEEDAA